MTQFKGSFMAYALPSVLLLILSCSNLTARADIVLIVGNATFIQNSGIQLLDVYARSATNDTTDFLTADFQLSAGVFPTTAGVFGDTNFIGQGNIDVASGFLSTGNNQATLSLDFTSPQSFPSLERLIAQLRINTSGIPIGNNYTVNVLNVASQATLNSGVAGAFSIVVPEPQSIYLFALAAIAMAVGWRKKTIG